MSSRAINREFLQLLWICGGKAEQASARWHRGLSPEIGIATIGSDRPDDLVATCVAALDGRPYAIAGYGCWALAGFELAGLLPVAPVHLMVAGSPAPRAVVAAVSCPVTAFAAHGGAAADDICQWGAVTSGPFCVRLLPGGQDGWFSPGAAMLLAIKEELRVWPA